MSQQNFFQFEADFVSSLRCIPMQVRFKLDTCGIKLKLAHWHQFSHTEHLQLVELPCTTAEEIEAYRNYLQSKVKEYTGTPPKELAIDPHPPWFKTAEVPPTVQAKAAEFGVNLSLEQWLNLNPLQRFALLKLSRTGHENKNFYPALKEFSLLS